MVGVRLRRGRRLKSLSLFEVRKRTSSLDMRSRKRKVNTQQYEWIYFVVYVIQNVYPECIEYLIVVFLIGRSSYFIACTPAIATPIVTSSPSRPKEQSSRPVTSVPWQSPQLLAQALR